MLVASLEGRPVNTLRATDFDVTLYDPAKGLEALADIAGRDLVGVETHINSHHMISTYKQFRDENRTFQPEEYLRYHGMSEDNITTVYSHFHELNEPELLFEDARRYIERVNSSPTDHLIIHTTGLYKTQRSKLGAVGLLGTGGSTPFRIIRSHEKGKDIAAWRNERGLYVPPDIELPHCELVVLAEDRRDAVGGMDQESSRVYLLERPGQSRRGAKVAVSFGVVVIQSLDEIPVPHVEAA